MNNTICFSIELNMRERQVSDLKLELERLNSELHSFKTKYFDMKRALDADEARRLKVPTPKTPEKTQSDHCKCCKCWTS